MHYAINAADFARTCVRSRCALDAQSARRHARNFDARNFVSTSWTLGRGSPGGRRLSTEQPRSGFKVDHARRGCTPHIHLSSALTTVFNLVSGAGKIHQSDVSLLQFSDHNVIIHSAPTITATLRENNVPTGNYLASFSTIYFWALIGADRDQHSKCLVRAPEALDHVIADTS